MQGNMRFVRTALYALKRQYGAPVTLYKMDSKDFNPKTGQKVTVRSHLSINLAIILPDSLANKFAYEHSYLAANRKFTFGTQWNQRQRLVVIDGADLPNQYEIELEDCLVFNNDRYVIRKVDKFDSGFGFILTITRAENNLPLQITDLSVDHVLGLEQAAGTI